VENTAKRVDKLIFWLLHLSINPGRVARAARTPGQIASDRRHYRPDAAGDFKGFFAN
jgi:hypothetical protein